MSVTFTIESNFTGEYAVDCDGKVIARTDDIDTARVVITAHKRVCDECDHYGMYATGVTDVDGSLDVNVSNMNARLLLSILGLDVDDSDLAGTINGQDFLARVMLAMAEDRDDSGVAPVDMYPGQGGAQMIDCGQRAGYFADRFDALHALASEAVRLGRDINFS